MMQKGTGGGQMPLKADSDNSLLELDVDPNEMDEADRPSKRIYFIY
jgi:hypothetical protein